MQCLALQRRRDQVRPQQRDVLLGIVDRQHVAAHARLEHHRRAAIGDMLFHQLAGALAAVHAEVDDPALGALGHLGHQLVVGVQHRCAVLAHDLDQQRFDLGQLLDRVDARAGPGDRR